MALITLTTDFGLQDWFVGTMKGVILSINPAATIVDLTNAVPPGDIRAGAFALAASCRYVPRGTIHVGVVDPGVGSSRGAVAVQTKDFIFVGPDNGLFSWVLRKQKVRSIRKLDNPRWFLPKVSNTFHGRDIFAPVAGYLSKRLSFTKLGKSQDDYVRLPWPEPTFSQRMIEGEVVYLDRFGNAITNIPNDLLKPLGDSGAVRIGAKQRFPLTRCYSAVPPGKLVAVPGSTGFLEVAVNGGNAARLLRIRVGTSITVGSSKEAPSLNRSKAERL